MSSIRKLDKSIKRWLNFFKRTDSHYNYDWVYLIQIEVEKMEQMLDTKYYNERDTRTLKWAIGLGKMVVDPYKSADRYVNLRNASRFVSPKRLKIVLLYLDKVAISDLLEEKAWYLYCKVRERYLRSWWF